MEFNDPEAPRVGEEGIGGPHFPLRPTAIPFMLPCKWVVLPLKILLYISIPSIAIILKESLSLVTQVRQFLFQAMEA